MHDRERKTFAGGTSFKILVTGGAGFIGSSLCESLLKEGHEVLCFDNFEKGSQWNLSKILTNRSFILTRGDCKTIDALEGVGHDFDVVYHLAASSEIRPEKIDSEITFAENVVATKNVLEFVRRSSVGLLVFTSSSTVYGDALIQPTTEDYAPMMPISVYGASKLASESLIAGYAQFYGFKSIVFRLANIVGPRSNHGVVTDFMTKLRKNSKELEILGDGTQTKSYLHVDDCVTAMTRSYSTEGSVTTFNLGTEDKITVKVVADTICEEHGVRPHYVFTGGVDGGKGWRGDVKNMLLDVSKLESAGWRPRFNSVEAVRETVRALLQGARE